MGVFESVCGGLAAEQIGCYHWRCSTSAISTMLHNMEAHYRRVTFSVCPEIPPAPRRDWGDYPSRPAQPLSHQGGCHLRLLCRPGGRPGGRVRLLRPLQGALQDLFQFCRRK
jgi:hypothetical protein